MQKAAGCDCFACGKSRWPADCTHTDTAFPHLRQYLNDSLQVPATGRHPILCGNAARLDGLS